MKRFSNLPGRGKLFPNFGRRFSNLPTRSKLFLSFGLMLVFLVAVSANAYISLQLTQRDSAIAMSLMASQNNLNRQRGDLLNMMLTTDRTERDTLRNNLQRLSKENDGIMLRLAEAERNNRKLQRRLAYLKVTLADFKQWRDEVVMPLIYRGDIAQAQALMQGTQNELFKTISGVVQELGDQAQTQAEQKANNAALIFGAVGLSAFLVGGLLALLLSRLIAEPLKEIGGVAERIAEGDLSVDITSLTDAGRTDEVGTLAQTFLRMRQSLGKTADVARQLAASDLRAQVAPQSQRDVLGNSFAAMVKNLREQTGEIAAASSVLGSVSSQISTSTTELAASASETAAAVTQTTATLEEIRRTAHMASEKAEAVAENARNAARISQTGRQATEETSQGILGIREQMEAISDSMMALSEQSQAIGEIIASVDDLAQQSNLLAVNASIEAAKAGEQGKGFAVVAQEVKNLADQSKQATTQVRTILSDIQKARATAVMAIEQGSKAVEAGVAQAAQAGESIQALTEGVDIAAASATQIAASSRQQLSGMDQMALAMESIKQATTQNVDGARQLEDAARNLNQLGQRLQELVGRYRM